MPRKHNNPEKQSEYFSGQTDRAFAAAVVRLLRLKARVPINPAREEGEEEISPEAALQRLRQTAAKPTKGEQDSLDRAAQARSKTTG